MRRKFKQKWQSLTIKKKIQTFTGAVCFVFVLSVIFNMWVLKYSFLDFNQILEENAQSIQLVQVLEEENRLFKAYVQQEDVTWEALEGAMECTNHAVFEMPFSYASIGENRYAQTWSLRSSYEVYQQKRNSFLEKGKTNPFYVKDLYELYEMQEYLLSYAKNLMTMTLEVGNEVYGKKIPGLFHMLWFVVILGSLIVVIIVKLSDVMNKTIISPVMKLVAMSKKIAGNDFFVEDVQVENEDELGELVHAFNKMKYATGEYITALENQRMTLDRLHEEELEKLEMEKQLESIHLRLLTSQINPHFLFNTLNVIAGMANLEDAETTEKMIRALSSLFRYNLKTPETEVALARELKVVEDYMYLQQMRFGNRIVSEISCEVDDERVLVPTFFLQPLVENAIIHGLAPKEEGGKIMIHIWEYGEALHITINDTGVGMEEEQLETLRKKLEGRDTNHQGIGLSNVYHRIMTLYQGSKVEVFSRKMEGTLIKIQIPIPMERKGKMT